MKLGALINFFSNARLTWLLALGMPAGWLAFGDGRLEGGVPEHWWSVLTYAFVHTNPMHLAVNLIALLVVATWCEQRQGAIRMAMVFVSGIVAGGVFFMGYATLSDAAMWLEGASAGIMAMTVCALLSYQKICIGAHRFPADGVAYALLVILASGLLGYNPGGAVAHIGGWVAGRVSAAIFAAKEARHSDTPAVMATQRVRTSGYASLTEAERLRMFNETKSREL